MPKKDTFRIVTRGVDGSLLIRDYPSSEPISEIHHQVGVDDCSTDLDLRVCQFSRVSSALCPRERQLSATNHPKSLKRSPRNGVRKNRDAVVAEGGAVHPLHPKGSHC